MEELPRDEVDALGTDPKKISRPRIGKILLAIIFLWVALNICFMILGAAQITWLQRIGLASFFYSLFGIPILAVGSIIAFATEPKKGTSHKGSRDIYMAIALAFAICAIIVLGGLLYALGHWQG